VLKEFREFVTKGNVLDLAVGVIIGGAFGKIVDSLVKDVIMPPIGLVLNRVDFTKLYIALDGNQYESLEAAQKAEAPVIAYGNFLNNVVSFVIVAFAIFMLIKQVNRLRRPAAAPPATEKPCQYCQLGVPILATRCPHCTSQLQAA
jgi:large conductance mechanosensitive channel